MTDAREVAGMLSEVQKGDILAGRTYPHACCPAPTLTANAQRVWAFSRHDSCWYLTPFGLEVRRILMEQDHG